MIDPTQLKRLADQQYGYFTAQQAISSGYAKDRHTYHVRCGHWEKVDRALFRLAGYTNTQFGDFARWTLWATMRNGGRVVVVSHGSALAFYGLSDECPGEVHLTVPHARQPREDKAGCQFHRDDLPSGDIQEETGFRVTTPLRTLRDMQSGLLLERQWEATVFRALEKRLVSQEDIRQLPVQSVRSRFSDAEYRAVAVAGKTPAPQYGVWGADVDKERPEMRRFIRQSNFPLPSAHEWRTASRSFTLVEMLVVILIINVLAAMLLPALGKALEASKLVSCGNNQKQIGSAINLYASDNFNILPGVWCAPTTWFTQWGGTVGALIPYLGNSYGKKSCFWCPSNLNGYFNQVNYLANSTILGGFGTFLRITSIPHPSRNIYVTDSSTDMGASLPTYWIVNTASDSSFLLNTFPSPHNDGIGHSVVYADGHVGIVSPLRKADLNRY